MPPLQHAPPASTLKKSMTSWSSGRPCCCWRIDVVAVVGGAVLSASTVKIDDVLIFREDGVVVEVDGVTRRQHVQRCAMYSTLLPGPCCACPRSRRCHSRASGKSVSPANSTPRAASSFAKSLAAPPNHTTARARWRRPRPRSHHPPVVVSVAHVAASAALASRAASSPVWATTPPRIHSRDGDPRDISHDSTAICRGGDHMLLQNVLHRVVAIPEIRRLDVRQVVPRLPQLYCHLP